MSVIEGPEDAAADLTLALDAGVRGEEEIGPWEDLTRDAADADHADVTGARGAAADSDGKAVSEDRSSFSFLFFSFAGAGAAGECWPMGTGKSPAMMGSAKAELSTTTGSSAQGTEGSSGVDVPSEPSTPLLAWACNSASLAEGGNASRAACWSDMFR